jgi:hypothetical protein
MACLAGDYCIDIMAAGYAFGNAGVLSSEELAPGRFHSGKGMAATAETAYLPVACAGPEKRMGAASPSEYSGCQEAIKNVIGGDARRISPVLHGVRVAVVLVRAGSARSDQPVLQALGRRIPAILHACFT